MNNLINGVVWSFIGIIGLSILMLILSKLKTNLNKYVNKNTILKMLIIWLAISAFLLLTIKVK